MSLTPSGAGDQVVRAAFWRKNLFYVIEVAAALVSIQCEAARNLEIAKARANAALYALLGVLQLGAVAVMQAIPPPRHARSVLGVF